MIAVAVGRAIALQLVETIERHVEPIAALVLEHRDFDDAALDGDRGDAAIDADAVVEVHHVVAQRQVAGDCRRRRLAVAARAPQPAGTPEDLVIGKDAERRHHEATVEGTDDERGAVGPESVGLQQFVEPFALSLVVAEDQRRSAMAEEGAQPVEISIDPFRREEAELDFGRLVAEHQAGEGRHAGLPLRRIEKEVLARRRVLAQAPGDVEMMFRFAPRPIHFLGVGVGALLDDQCVGREQFQQRTSFDRTVGRRRGRRLRHSGSAGW